MSDTKTEANGPHFFYLRFVLKTITALKATFPEDIRLISIGVSATKSVVYDRSVHSIQWFDKKATLNLGKNMVIDVGSSELAFKLETANNKYTGVVDLDEFQTSKPFSRSIILRSNSSSIDSPEYELEYALLKDALHIQSKVTQNPSTVEMNTQTEFQPRSVSVSTQSETATQSRDCGTQMNPLTHVDASTLTLESLPSTDHQRQVLIRLIPLLVNRIYLRLCQQEQLKHNDSKDVKSRAVNTDFTVPSDVNQRDLDNYIQVEHIQKLKMQMKSLSKKREEMNKMQSRQPTKRLCKELKKEQPNTAKIVRSRQMNITRELKKMMVDEGIQFEDIEINEPSTSKAEIERNEMKVKQPASQQIQQPTKEPKTTITRVQPTVQPSNQPPPKLLNTLPKQPDSIVEEVSEESDDELSDESRNESTDESDETTEKSAVESTSVDEEQSSGSAIESSVHEEIHESISSSVPSELASAVQSSRASYLESVASSSS